ncbi:Fanconi anemia group M protein [Harpegnathos saltator]|uniref:Fanconi anemia group M protein n=1 Tax=Harpegnathos saltator TaxID=610380 RepID=E2BHC3_HARSA|nr:Fanconi anemia group M protein [Harpegnathos saltator]EFN84892.1 Fanconi anemia group M protein [Harpegnathos saltator]
MELSMQITQTSKDPETKGFDLSAGNTWVYPENYPVRKYQYNIVETALYHNTLVCLPTGLGKTFIAAVIMYNFWRWFPFGKIVFLAPTKPLVGQQIDACYEIMGIPSVDMIKLTGAVNQKNRQIYWFKKRIIFATPQVFHKDLEKSIVPSHLVKCVVVDEAHKALGKHSYCESIRILSTQNKYFRILALSATPGNKIDNVHEVIQNLYISHLELRDEDSIDIIPYVNKRKIDTILIPLSNELAQFKERYIIIMDRHVKFLIQYNVLRGHTANISKGRIFHLLNEFKERTNKSGNYGQIMKTLNILLTMYHAYDLMIRHGLRAFCKFYQNHSDKFWMNNENQLRQLLYDIETYLGPFPDILPNGHVSEMPTNIMFGHNKFYKLKELLERHFRKNNGENADTRAIVFVEYRDIVNEVYILLLQSKPLIRPQMFVGQASQKQKQQIKALEDFRNNHVNVLISTSIGEEGLDVGEVDLIICFDVSQHSPTRLVQRMGRTGRKRDGHIIILVTDGKEYENLKSTLSKRNSINNKILNTSNIFSSLYQSNPRMIPNQFTPECHMMHITPVQKTPNVSSKRKKKRVNKENEASSIKQKETTSNNAGESLMMKFLTNNKYEQKQNGACNIYTLTTQSGNVHNTIDPNHVKLLSDDNAGIDFMTLCAVKKSEEEISSEIVRKMDTTYIPAAKPVKDPFNFVIPDIQILDSLPLLITNLINHLPKTEENRENENIQNDNNHISIDDDNFWCTIPNKRNIDTDEVRFEDILDDSSDSNITIVSFVSRAIDEIEIDSVDTSKVLSSSIKDNNDIVIDRAKTELSDDILNKMEPGMFENILDDSFSSTDDDLETKDTAHPNIVSSNFSNTSDKNTDDINAASESIADIFLDDTNADEFNQSLLAPAKSVELDQANKPTENYIDDIDEIDLIFSDDDIMAEFTSDKFNKSKSIHNSKPEESFLSITQAIEEIARIKKNVEKSPELCVSKRDSSPEWISTDNKRQARIEKRNTRSGLKDKLSHINFNSITKSYNAKRHLDFQDSDEDFMITEDNVKKFDELESSYFCRTSKTSKNGSNHLHKTNNLVNNKNYFGDTSKSFAAGNSNFYSTSKEAKLLGNPTLVDNKRSMLSLKRSKNPCSSTIDLSAFKAPSKCINSRQEQNALGSDISTSKQISCLNREITRKISFKHERKRQKNEFIDDEAQASSNDSTSDESTSTIDEELRDFVSYTQNVENQVDMEAHYLQTVKSPIRRPGAFHFKKPRLPDPNVEIYSQSLSQVHDSYLYDSFCVREDAEETSVFHNESILEVAERKLECNKRKRLHLNKDSAKQINKRKNMNILNKSVSSEDEIEQLRIEVQED